MPINRFPGANGTSNAGKTGPCRRVITIAAPIPGDVL